MHTSSHRVGFADGLCPNWGTGSLLTTNRFGMLLVAALAARVATSPAVTITAPNACSWSAWFPAQRYSITNFQGFNVAGFVQIPPEAGQSRGVRLRATRGSNTQSPASPAAHALPAATRLPLRRAA
jgi:hypothetical protein